MDNEKFQDLVLNHMARLTQDMTAVKSDISAVKSDISAVKSDISAVKNRVAKLETLVENNVAEKLEALFDGYKQMGEQLDRIEAKVDLHDEMIFKRVK